MTEEAPDFLKQTNAAIANLYELHDKTVQLWWATVVQESPLMLIRDGDRDLVAYQPAVCAIPDLVLGERVLTAVRGAHVTVLQVAGRPQRFPATQSEVDAGTDTLRYVTPKTLLDAHNTVQKVMLTSDNIITSGGSATIEDGNLKLVTAGNAFGFKDVFEPGFDYIVEGVIQAVTPAGGSLWAKCVLNGAITTDGGRYQMAGTSVTPGSATIFGYSSAAAASMPVVHGANAGTLWYESRVKLIEPAGTQRSKYEIDGWCISTPRATQALGWDAPESQQYDGFVFIAQNAGNNITSARISVTRIPGNQTYPI